MTDETINWAMAAEEAKAQFDEHVAWASDQVAMIEAQVDALGEALFLMSGPLRASGFLDNVENHQIYEKVVAAYREIGWGGDEAVPECPYCDGTGDVHRADGEWLGECDCNPTQPPSA